MTARSLILGLVVAILGGIALCGVMWLGTLTDVGPIGMRLVRTQQVISVYVWIVGLVLVGVLLAAGFETHSRGEDFPHLYGPAIVTAICFMGLLQVIALRSLDVMDEAQQRNWALLYEPETALLVLALYIGLAAGLAWKASIIERGHGIRWEILIAVFLVPSLVATVVVSEALGR